MTFEEVEQSPEGAQFWAMKGTDFRSRGAEGQQFDRALKSDGMVCVAQFSEHQELKPLVVRSSAFELTTHR